MSQNLLLPTITTSHNRNCAVHVLVEVFGGKFLLQKGYDDKWRAGAFIKYKNNVMYKNSERDAIYALQALNRDLGVEAARKRDLQKIASINDALHGNISVFTYLMDLETETLELNPKTVKEIVIAKLDHVIEDVQNQRNKYDPLFVQLFNIFLTLKKGIT